MEIENLSSKKKINRKNHPELPASIRGLIVGKSGCGKTNLLMNLLLKEGLLDYDNLMVYGKSLFQEEYELLKKLEEFPKDVVHRLFQIQNGVEVEEILDYFRNTENMNLISV